MGRKALPVSPRIESRSQPEATTGCRLWTGGKNGDGYGALRVNGRVKLAHVVAYELVCGPIPDGMMLDHTCRNRACVNPAHLEPVTNRVNVLRGEGITARESRQTHCKHGHEFTAENTAIRRGRRCCRLCERRRAKRG